MGAVDCEIGPPGSSASQRHRNLRKCTVNLSQVARGPTPPGITESIKNRLSLAAGLVKEHLDIGPSSSASTDGGESIKNRLSSAAGLVKEYLDIGPSSSAST